LSSCPHKSMHIQILPSSCIHISTITSLASDASNRSSGIIVGVDGHGVAIAGVVFVAIIVFVLLCVVFLVVIVVVVVVIVAFVTLVVCIVIVRVIMAPRVHASTYKAVVVTVIVVTAQTL